MADSELQSRLIARAEPDSNLTLTDLWFAATNHVLLVSNSMVHSHKTSSFIHITHQVDQVSGCTQTVDWEIENIDGMANSRK